MKVKEYEGRSYFTGWAGLDLFFDRKRPEGAPKGTVVLLHGYADHSGRYTEVVGSLVERGYSVYFYDQRGHGCSEGVRGDVIKFIDYVRDLNTFVRYVRENEQTDESNTKLFLLAHSTGACASVAFAAENPDLVDGLVSCGIYLRDAGEYSRLKIGFGRLLVPFVPLLPIQELDPNRLAENPNACRAFKEDPLAYHGGVRVRMGMHFVDMEKNLDKPVQTVACPLLILHGENDRLASIDGSRKLYELAKSSDKTLHIVSGAGHEVLHDYGKRETMATIGDWIDSRAGS